MAYIRTIYAQMTTAFMTQGLSLDLYLFQIGEVPIFLPAAVLNVFDTVAILVLVPIFDRLIYPLLERNGIKFGMLKRIGAGFILAILSMVAAAVLESFRLDYIYNGDTIANIVSGKVLVGAKLSIFYQIPQYFLVGASEVLTSISGIILIFN